MRQTIQVWLEDKHGALMRVAGVISAKGANIHALTVIPDPCREGASRMTLVADVEPRLQQRIVNEMNRLVNVFAAVDVSANPRQTLWPGSLHEPMPAPAVRSEELTS